MVVTYGDPGGANRSLANDTRGLSNLLWTIGRSRRAGVDCGLQYVEDLHNEVLGDFVAFGTAAVLREIRQTTAVYQQGEMIALFRTQEIRLRSQEFRRWWAANDGASHVLDTLLHEASLRGLSA